VKVLMHTQHIESHLQPINDLPISALLNGFCLLTYHSIVRSHLIAKRSRSGNRISRYLAHCL